MQTYIIKSTTMDNFRLPGKTYVKSRKKLAPCYCIVLAASKYFHFAKK